MASTSSYVQLELNESDVEGAFLPEPLDAHTVPQLKWWLTCHGCKFPSNEKKQQLITRIHEAQTKGVNVVDVDGTYLEKKRKRLLEAGETVPAASALPVFPQSGWRTISPGTDTTLETDFPSVSQGTLYTYLAEGVGNIQGKRAFRALTRGYVHYASGRVKSIEIQNESTSHTFIRSLMIPSMKPGQYKVEVMLKKEYIQQECIGKVVQATCNCAAGLSASCVHVSALLHVLTDLKPSKTHHNICSSEESDDDSDKVPCTSKLCSWRVPKKRKEAALKMSDARFEKHEYQIVKKYKFDDIETFDPRPNEMKGKAREYLPRLLDRLSGKQLCVSLMFDQSYQHFTPLSKADMLEKVQALKHQKLGVSDQEIRMIERETRTQHMSPRWFDVRNLRLTSSMFGHVRRLQESTAPDNLVLQVLGVKQPHGPALEYGRSMEDEARIQYTQYQLSNGHPGLFVTECGFHIHPLYNFLGASPDGAVYDPSSTDPFGFLEIKCSYKYQDSTPHEAARNADFWLSATDDSSVKLKRNHIYFSQVQGHMACGQRPWCDFCTFTKKSIYVERITFDQVLWENDILPKLIKFYDCCVAPEIICPQSAIGLKVRDLRHE